MIRVLGLRIESWRVLVRGIGFGKGLFVVVALMPGKIRVAKFIWDILLWFVLNHRYLQVSFCTFQSLHQIFVGRLPYDGIRLADRIVLMLLWPFSMFLSTIKI